MIFLEKQLKYDLDDDPFDKNDDKSDHAKSVDDDVLEQNVTSVSQSNWSSG